MTHIFKPAARENTQLIIGSIGPSGSGKTYSLFELATGLAYPEATNAEQLAKIIQAEGRNRIVSIDTERGRALHYAPAPGDRADPWKQGGATFAFDHALLEPPFSPAHYQELLEAADDAGYRVIILDSGSHEWSGEGGVLEMHEAQQIAMATRKANYNSRPGEPQKEPGWKELEAAKMTAWIKPKMDHKKLVGRATTLNAHLLVALRAEEKVRMTEEVDGQGRKKTKIIAASALPPKDRWTPVCEKAFPYELTISFVLTPDQPGFPVHLKVQDQHKPFLPTDRPISIETGRQLAAWAGGASGPTKASPAISPEPKTTGGGKRTPEQLAEDLKAKVRDAGSVDDLKVFWKTTERFRTQIEERGLTALLTSCEDAYNLRLDELSRSGQFELED